MPKSLSFRLLAIIFFSFSLSYLFLPFPVLAIDPATQSGQVSATVPSAPSTSGNQAPTTPILIRPRDGTVTSDPNPELVWRASSDPDGNDLFYDLYLDGVATFLGISNLGNSSGVGYTARIENHQLRLLPTFDFAPGKHQWYVRAYDPGGAGTNSTQWNFLIDLTPPYLLVTDIDIHHQLRLDSRNPDSIPEHTSFTVRGPKDIYFTVHTEPYASIQLTISNLNKTPPFTSTVSASGSAAGIAYPYLHLLPGSYTVQLLALDRANLTTILPEFQLEVTESTLTFPPFGPSRFKFTFPPAPGLPPSYSATIQRITTRETMSLIIHYLLAITITLLIIILKKRRYNLILLNARGLPLSQATIYHSRPFPHYPVKSIKKLLPCTYRLRRRNRGRLYLPRLGYRSTLTIRTNNTLTILSLLHSPSPVTLVFG